MGLANRESRETARWAEGRTGSVAPDTTCSQVEGSAFRGPNPDLTADFCESQGVIGAAMPAKAIRCMVLVAGAAVLISCGEEPRQSAKAPSYPELRSGLAGSPPPLAATHALMGRVLDGRSKPGFEPALRSLRGYPTVVNIWASWCGPCRYEFPVLGQASLKLGRTTGFLGISTRDNRANAQSFLNGHPVGYPSWTDDSGSLATAAGAGPGLPVTAIYDRSGRRAYVHQGPYASVEALAADIRRYGDGR